MRFQKKRMQKKRIQGVCYTSKYRNVVEKGNGNEEVVFCGVSVSVSAFLESVFFESVFLESVFRITHQRIWCIHKRVRGTNLPKPRATVGSSASQSSVIRRQDGLWKHSLVVTFLYAINQHEKIHITFDKTPLPSETAHPSFCRHRVRWILTHQQHP